MSVISTMVKAVERGVRNDGGHRVAVKGAWTRNGRLQEQNLFGPRRQSVPCAWPTTGAKSPKAERPRRVAPHIRATIPHADAEDPKKIFIDHGRDCTRCAGLSSVSRR